MSTFPIIQTSFSTDLASTLYLRQTLSLSRVRIFVYRVFELLIDVLTCAFY